MTWIFFGVTPTPIRPASRISISRAGPAVPTPPSRSGLASRSGTPQRIGNTLIGDRPMTGLARPPTVGVNPAVRPITQQGLSGGRAVSRLGTRSMRQVHDKSYFMGILRSKMNQLTAEITRLEEVYKKGERDRMELDAYEQRAKMSATELKELQGKLVDYNVLVDRMHMNHDVNEIEADARRAKETADEIEAAVQELFTERQAREREIEEITMEIDEQKRLNQAILAGMDPSIREHYESTKKQNEALKAEVEEMEKELKHLHERKDQLEMEVSNSPLKKKAIQMQQNLDELQSRERILLSEKEAQETPEEKKQRLIDQIKLNNDDISMMEKQIQKTSELINLAHEEISEFDSSADRNLAKNSEKYRELMMKEREYDEFLSAYDKQKQSLTIELDEYSEEVVRLLQKMSANILKLKMDSNLNAVDDDDDVTLSIQGNASIEELQNLYVRLQEESISLDEHRTSLQSEIETFDHRLDELSKQLAKYSDLDRISVEAENNIKKLENRRDELEKVLPGYEERCEELKEKLRQRTEQLEKNPKYTIDKLWQCSIPVAGCAHAFVFNVI